MKDTVIKGFKWAAVIPVAIIGYMLGKFLVAFGFESISEATVKDITASAGLEGHYILGPIYLITRESAGIACCVMTGSSIAPSRQKTTSYVLLSLVVTFILSIVIYNYYTAFLAIKYLSVSIPGTAIARAVIELLGIIIGVGFTLFYIKDELSDF